MPGGGGGESACPEGKQRRATRGVEARSQGKVTHKNTNNDNSDDDDNANTNTNTSSNTNTEPAQ